MGKKGICKLAYRVLKTWVPYKTRVLKTLFLRFLLANLDKFLPHRSWVFYTRFQNTQNIEENPKERKKEERRKPSRKKERRRRSTVKKKIHSKEEDPRHKQTLSPSSTSQLSIYDAIHDLHGCSSQFVDYSAFTISSSSCMVSAH